MAVNAVSATKTDLSGAKILPANSQQGLGQDAFLKLLVAQMSNQDPLAPQDQQQFLAQLAQFSTVEGVNNMKDSQSRLQATSLLGKKVDATVIANNLSKEVSGTVTNVRFDSKGVLLTLKGQEQAIRLEDVTTVQGG